MTRPSQLSPAQLRLTFLRSASIGDVEDERFREEEYHVYPWLATSLLVQDTNIIKIEGENGKLERGMALGKEK